MAAAAAAPTAPSSQSAGGSHWYTGTSNAGNSSGSSSAAAAVPWDEQVVPALRRQLEAESAHLTKRISRLDSGRGTGWAPLGQQAPRNGAGNDRYEGRQRRVEPSVDASDQASSSLAQHYGTPSRSASTRIRGVVQQQHATEMAPSSLNGASKYAEISYRSRSNAADLVSPGPSKMETEKARQRARMLRERKLSQTSSAAAQTAVAAAPATQAKIYVQTPHTNQQATDGDSSSQLSPTSRSLSPRLRTQSTPMQPQPLGYYNRSAGQYGQNKAQLEPQRHESIYSGPQASLGRQPSFPSPDGHRREKAVTERSNGSERPNKYSESGRRWPSETPASHSQLRSATVGALGESSSSSKSGNAERPSASQAAGPSSRSIRAATEPPADTRAGLWDWEEVLPPTIARRVAQQELMKRDPSLKDVDRLIDTWDKSGLPMTQKAIEAFAADSVGAAVAEKERRNTEDDDVFEMQAIPKQYPQANSVSKSPKLPPSPQESSRAERMSQLVDGMGLGQVPSLQSNHDSTRSKGTQSVQARQPQPHQPYQPRPQVSPQKSQERFHAALQAAKQPKQPLQSNALSGPRPAPKPEQSQKPHQAEEKASGCCTSCVVM